MSYTTMLESENDRLMSIISEMFRLSWKLHPGNNQLWQLMIGDSKVSVARIIFISGGYQLAWESNFPAFLPSHYETLEEAKNDAIRKLRSVVIKR